MFAHGVRLTIAYDGTDFCGWQKQRAERSVQKVLEDTIAGITGHPIKLRAASRTDSGVHALGNVAAFCTSRFIDTTGWRQGINSELPEDVSVTHVSACSPDYNPRHDTLGKRYRYLLEIARVRHPLYRKYVWHPHVAAQSFDVERLRHGAKIFEGTHDFAAFRNSADTRVSTVRHISEIKVDPGFSNEPSLIAVEVHGTAFMHHMVRIMVGTLLKVAIGRMSLDQLRELLGPLGTRGRAGMTAPASGLCLKEVLLGRQIEGAS